MKQLFFGGCFFNQKLVACQAPPWPLFTFEGSQLFFLFIILCIEINGFWLVQQKMCSFLKSTLRCCFHSALGAWTGMVSTRKSHSSCSLGTSSSALQTNEFSELLGSYPHWISEPLFEACLVLTRNLSREEVCLWKDILDSFIWSQQKQFSFPGCSNWFLFFIYCFEVKQVID